MGSTERLLIKEDRIERAFVSYPAYRRRVYLTSGLPFLMR